MSILEGELDQIKLDTVRQAHDLVNMAKQQSEVRYPVSDSPSRWPFREKLASFSENAAGIVGFGLIAGCLLIAYLLKVPFDYTKLAGLGQNRNPRALEKHSPPTQRIR